MFFNSKLLLLHQKHTNLHRLFFYSEQIPPEFASPSPLVVFRAATLNRSAATGRQFGTISVS
jgi:hypothetical protein